MKYLWYFAPAAILFMTPWLHKLAYENLIWAFPEIAGGWGHTLVIIGVVCSCFAAGAAYETVHGKETSEK